MKLYQAGRGQGKTYMLMELLEMFPKDVLVCHSSVEVARLKKAYPLQAEQIYAIDAVRDGRLRGKQINAIHVDNLDLILPYLLGGRVGIVTTTEG